MLLRLSNTRLTVNEPLSSTLPSNSSKNESENSKSKSCSPSDNPSKGMMKYRLGINTALNYPFKIKERKGNKLGEI